MKLYLSGPMRGFAEFNAPAFNVAAKRLREEGHEVNSPIEHDAPEAACLPSSTLMAR